MKKELKDKINKVLVFLYCDNPIAKRYKLKKIKGYLTVVGLENVKKLDIKSEKLNLESVNYSGDDIIDSYIDKFIEVVQEKISSDKLSNLYDNISWVKIYILDNIKDEWYVQGETLAEYFSETNELNIVKTSKANATYHDLFHLASNNPNTKDFAIGFKYGMDDWEIGTGINEGYTELLVERYFGLENSNLYNFEKSVVRRLDIIIGKEKMESFYFNYDLFGLINELKQFYSLEEIEKFLIGVDFISLYSENRFLGKNEINIMVYKLKEIIGFLLKGYCIKLSKKDYDKIKKKEMIEEFLITFDLDIFSDDTVVAFNEINYFNDIINTYLDSDIKLDINNSQNKNNVL